MSTIEISISDDQEPVHYDLLFDWIEQTEEGQEFLSDSIAGNVTAGRTSHIARRFGIPFGLLWGIVFRCYEHDGYLGTFVGPING